MDSNTDISVLIISCDSYSDVWGTFFHLLNTYWDDCPYPIYLGTNKKIINEPRVATICIGDDKSWCANLKSMLYEIPTSHVIIFLEDYFLDKRVNTDAFKELFNYMVRNDIDCLRLRNSPVACCLANKELDIGYAEPDSPYYINAQPAIWKKSALLGLLNPSWSAWDFERENTKRANILGLKIYTTNYQLISCLNGVVRGKYLLSTLNSLEAKGFTIEVGDRDIYDNSSIFNRMHPIRVMIKHHMHAIFIRLKLYKTFLRRFYL